MGRGGEGVAKLYTNTARKKERKKDRNKERKKAKKDEVKNKLLLKRYKIP